MPAKKTAKTAPKTKQHSCYCCSGCGATWGWILLILGIIIFFQELFQWGTNISAWALAFILLGAWILKTNPPKK